MYETALSKADEAARKDKVIMKTETMQGAFANYTGRCTMEECE